MSRQSRKQKEGELEFCHKLHDRGYGAYRSSQHAGVAERDDSADVITSLHRKVRFEIKRGYNDTRLWHQTIWKWIEKIREETPNGKVWCVAWRPDNSFWIFFLPSAPGLRHRDQEGSLVSTFEAPEKRPWIVLPSFEQMLHVVDGHGKARVEEPEEWML